MANFPTVKVLVLGGKSVGKTAIIVRFLTRRYIGEYRSYPDWLYKKTLNFEDGMANVEILDTSKWNEEEYEISKEDIRWADAFVVIYSICDRNTFNQALSCVETIQNVRTPSYVPLLLVGNMRDLEHARDVSMAEGHEFSSQLGVQFCEISAAENYVGVSVTFNNLIKEVRGLQMQRSLPRHRKLSIVTVSKVFGAVFGKNSNKQSSRKRRTSFSL